MHEERDVPDAQADERLTRTRSTLLPEEQAVGSEDPAAQAREVLRDSEHRTEAAPAEEHRRSEDTT